MALWTPAVDYYTLDNSMTMAAAGDKAHPGLAEDAGQPDGAGVGNGAGEWL